MKKINTLILAFAVISQLTWGQFYTKLNPQIRRELAEAYYLVGNQYEKIGEADKGRSYREMAFYINPNLDPDSIRSEELPTAAALIMRREARLLTPPEERLEYIQELIRSKFLRLVSSFLASDTEAMLELLEGSIYLTRLNTEITQSQIKSELDQFFSTVSLSGLVPSKVYDLSSMDIRKTPLTPDEWGDTYSIDVDTLIDFSEYIRIWEKKQRFLIHCSENRWLILAMGQGIPPSDWVPKRAPQLDAAPGTSIPLTGPGQEIKNAFLSCLAYFLNKDIPKAVDYFSEEIQILRLNATLTKNEISSTFEGYIENRDFSQLRSEDILVKESIFVEDTDQFADIKDGRAYLLNVKTKLDLSEEIPFWTRFQEYYFIEEEGTWKIFAIF